MRKITLFLSMLIAMTTTVVAQNTLDLTFTRVSTTEATVAIAGAGDDAVEVGEITAAVTANYDWKDLPAATTSETFPNASILCPDKNTSAMMNGAEGVFTITLNNVPDNYSFGDVTFTSCAINGQGQFQGDAVNAQQVNFTLKNGDAVLGTVENQAIKVNSGGGESVTVNFDVADSYKAVDGTLTLTLTLAVTEAKGCFYGLTKISIEANEVATETPVAYTASVTTNPATIDATAATVIVEDGVATFTATAPDGYEFVNWTKGTETESTENPYQVTLTENLELVANFQEKVVLPEEKEYTYTLTETRLSASDLMAKTEPVYIAIKNLSYTNSYYFVGNTGAAPYSQAEFSEDAVFVWEPMVAGTLYKLKKLDGTYMSGATPTTFSSDPSAAGIFAAINPTTANGLLSRDSEGDNVDSEDLLVRFVNGGATGSSWLNVQDGDTGTPTYNTERGGWTIHYAYEVKVEETEKPAGIDFDKTYKVKFDAERLSIKDEAYSSYLPTEWDITFQYSSDADKYFIKDFLGANLIDMNYGYTTYTVSDDNPYQFDINIEEGYNTLCMLDDTYENYLIFCNKDGEQSGSITVTVDDEGNATVGDFSVYYLKANADNGATEELKLVAVYGEDEVVEPAGPEVVFEMTAGQIGTVPQKLSDEDAAKIFDLSTLTIAVKVTTPASMDESGRQALLCTSDPTANANTDAMPTGSAYVGYGFNNADIGYLASCKDGDRYTTKSGITGGTDNVLVYVLNPDGNNFKSYVNGNVIQNRDFGGYEIATPKMVKEDHSNACIYIGGGMTAEGAREAYTGTIKGIKIFNGELTAEEIANIVFPEEPEAASYTVTANVAPVSDWGTVTIEGYEGTEASIKEGTEVTLTATPAEGYEFDSWTDIAGNELSKEASYKFTVTADVTVIAYFAEKAVGAEYFSIEKVSPDEGVVTVLSQIHLTPTVSSLYDLPTGWTITDANNNSYEVSIEWGMNPWYDVLVRLKEPITAPGTYTLTIPEGSAQDDNGKIISVATYSWTIEETATGINGIDAENGETVIFDITGRKIEAITAPGVYIVNGKKVLVK